MTRIIHGVNDISEFYLKKYPIMSNNNLKMFFEWHHDNQWIKLYLPESKRSCLSRGQKVKIRVNNPRYDDFDLPHSGRHAF